MLGRGASIQLARVFGIRIGATPSWFVVLFVFIYVLTGYFGDVVGHASSTQAFLLAVAAALLFFASLILHELGHAIVARRNGIGTTGIDLWLFGGVAKLTREADTPGAEFRIAAAGPLVTAAIIGVSIAAGALASHAGDVVASARFLDDPTSPGYALLGWLASINVILLAFNLVPALPLDGGRIARAAAWKKTGDRNKGTRFAGRSGQGFGYVLMGGGIFLAATSDPLNGIYLVIMGMFVHQAARQEILSSAFAERIGGITVADVMEHDPVAIPAAMPALQAEDEFVLRYRYPWFWVVDEGGRYLGVVRDAAVRDAVHAGRPALPVAELAEEDPSRFRIPRDRPLDAVLGEPGLLELGALAAIDAEGVLVGMVTPERVRRALMSAADV
jgi:Zn-dependent protease